VERLAEDHENARRLAVALAETEGFSIDPAQVETNIVVADISDTGKTAEEVLDRLAAEGVLAVSFGPTTLRFVTHKDVSRKDIDEAVLRIRRAVDSF
jgi:threonine aldolase